MMAMKNKTSIRFLFLVFPALIPGMASGFAGEADVIGAKLRHDGGNRYTVSATIAHGDRGWNHYADAFEVVGPDGKVLGVRVLHHPHVNEQPFTRSLGGIEIPSGVNQITVRARDSVHGFGGAKVTVPVPGHGGT